MGYRQRMCGITCFDDRQHRPKASFRSLDPWIGICICKYGGEDAHIALRFIARHPTRGKQSLGAAGPLHADEIVASYMVTAVSACMRVQMLHGSYRASSVRLACHVCLKTAHPQFFV